MKTKEVIESYLDKSDWRVNENSNAAPTIGAMTKHLAGQAFSEYWREEIYAPVNPEIMRAHDEGYFHIHDLSSGLTLYCCGYSLEKILEEGIHGIPNVSRSSPPKHIDSAFAQIVNLTTTFQNEIAGAVAFSSVDTRLAPYIKKDNLDETEVLQEVQRFIYALNSNSRCGAEPAFTNITMDLKVPKDMIDKHPIIAGREMPFTYAECQEEMDMINRAFLRVFIEGDYNQRPFAYPIPTYNITKDFDWNSPISELLFELAGKYGIPYFANYINSDMDPSEARSMCPIIGDTLIDILDDSGNVKVVPIREIVGKEVSVRYGDTWRLARGIRSEEQILYKIRDNSGSEHYLGEYHLQPIIRNDSVTTVHAGELKIGDYLIYSDSGIKKFYEIISIDILDLCDDLYCVEVL